MSGRRALVLGASGFLGSHVTRRLVERGDDVRVLLRTTSPTKEIDDLDVERRYGDIFDEQAVRDAMTGCDVVYYCVVDARAWLRDPAPLFSTNVDGLRRVLDIASRADLHRFVFTSTIGTVAIGSDRPATEDDAFNWHDRMAMRDPALALHERWGGRLYWHDGGHVGQVFSRRVQAESERFLTASVASTQ